MFVTLLLVTLVASLATAALVVGFFRAPIGSAASSAVIGRAGRRWHWQSWAGSNSRQNLHRVGGPGVWVQSADHPPCPGCDRAMP